MQDSAIRDHGGDLDRAMRQYGAGHWVDLSTGINPVPYPVSPFSHHSLANLPTRADITKLEDMAAQAYGTGAHVVALAGAQAVIQLVPRLQAPGTACVVGPTYNEHAAALRAQGWNVRMVDRPEDGAKADLLVVVNPNNPDGRCWMPDQLLALRGQVGLLVVDESFGDVDPQLSLAPMLNTYDEGIVVMRSFGKFYGLAGLRLGFALTGSKPALTLRALAGPWSVSGPAIAAGTEALADTDWQERTRARLALDAQRLDNLALKAGWQLVGGTALFRTYDTPDAGVVQDHLAHHHIWSRVFPYSKTWLRLGLPGSYDDWDQVEAALGKS